MREEEGVEEGPRGAWAGVAGRVSEERHQRAPDGAGVGWYASAEEGASVASDDADKTWGLRRQAAERAEATRVQHIADGEALELDLAAAGPEPLRRHLAHLVWRTTAEKIMLSGIRMTRPPMASSTVASGAVR